MQISRDHPNCIIGSGAYVYYYTYDKVIHRKNPDGSNMTVVEEGADSFNVYNNYISYTSGTSIMQVNIDGTNPQVITK